MPGYVRCPKCHRPLPRTARESISPVGGTAVAPKRGVPVLAIAAAVLAGGGFIAFFALRGTGRNAAAVAPLDAAAPDPGAPAAAAPTEASSITPVTATHAPNAGAIAAQLQRTLQRLELWSTVTVVGARVELQSGACRDPQLDKQLAAVTASFRAAGLTRVRCVEQSGAVVFDRDL